MKKLIYISMLAILACSSPSKKELFKITDSFVESLQTEYESYGVFGVQEHLKKTSDGQYQIMPVGRLINVKILKVVSEDVYKDLEEDIENHYKNDNRVNDVYINQGGTIIIDCRN